MTSRLQVQRVQEQAEQQVAAAQAAADERVRKVRPLRRTKDRLLNTC